MEDNEENNRGIELVEAGVRNNRAAVDETGILTFTTSLKGYLFNAYIFVLF